MKIRSITLFANPGQEVSDQFLDFAGEFARNAGKISRDFGLEVQTIRFGSPPFPLFLSGLSSSSILSSAIQLEDRLFEEGFEYISLGPALPSHPESYAIIPELIQATTRSFFSGMLTETGSGVSLPAVRSCGKIIESLAPQDPDGFANLYFAALGNVPPGSPFFPAAYHSSGEPTFAFALEGADLAVKAFSDSKTLENARQKLILAMEELDHRLGELASNLQEISGVKFTGTDYSLAPYPEDRTSLGNALEQLGLSKLGDHGSLATAAFLADSIDRASVKRTGFSGLMLPVLEDSRLADRAADGSLSLKDLLLFSAVCGTGLDTIPLPGDTQAESISAILLDLAALSLRLDKPLTARLMPIPGKKAGDETEFDFAFFANSKVMKIQSGELSGPLAGSGYLDLLPRGKFFE